MINFLITAVLFIAVLGILVCIHEFGHFIAAKWSGVRVDEFGFGFPPRLFGVKFGDTLYSVNAVPLGGFVRIKGIAGEEIEEVDETRHETTTHRFHDKDSFAVQPFWKKLSILFAGIGMNFFLAAILFSIAFSLGVKAPIAQNSTTKSEPEIIVTQVRAGSPAEKAGIVTANQITAKNGAPITTVKDLQGFSEKDLGIPVVLSVLSGGKAQDVTVSPAEIITDSGERYIGIGVGLAAVETVQYPPHLALVEGVKETVISTIGIFQGFGLLFVRLFSDTGSVAQDLAGPIGIAKITRGAADLGISSLVQFMAILSVNLAVFNFLPIPALDGGRITMAVLTAIRKKPISEKTETLVHSIGFLFLLMLVIAVTYQDIIKIVQ